MKTATSEKKKKLQVYLNESLNIDEDLVKEERDFKELFSFENIREVVKKVESLEEENINLRSEV